MAGSKPFFDVYKFTNEIKQRHTYILYKYTDINCINFELNSQN